MNYCWFFVIPLFLISCDNNGGDAEGLGSGSAETRAGLQDKLKIPKKITERHVILSNWYLDQYRACDTLNEIEGIVLESGTKIDVSPESMLNKQRDCLESLRPDLFESEPVRIWFEDQELVTEKLYSDLGVELEIVGVHARTLEGAIKIIELQERALEELLKVN